MTGKMCAAFAPSKEHDRMIGAGRRNGQRGELVFRRQHMILGTGELNGGFARI